MSGPRILCVCSDEGIELFGSRGCSTHLREMCQAFKSLGCVVKLLVANSQGQKDPSFDVEYELVPPVRSKKLGYDLRKLLTNRRFSRRLRELVGQFRPDIIYERYDLYSSAAANIASRTHTTYVLEVNAPLIDEMRGLLHFPRLANSYQRRTFRKADLLIGVSDTICSMLRTIAPDSHVLLVENGVNEDVFNVGVSGEEVRRLYGVDGKLVVGCTGSLRGRQGIDTLVRAASILLSERDDVRFLVVGGGNNLQRYRQMAQDWGLSDKFLLVGSVPSTEVPSYIAASDVCVAPYAPSANFYLSPMKIREYVAMRKPIVASDVPQIAKTIRDNVDGLLARPGDEKDLASKIAVMLDDAALRDRLARTGHERWAGKLSWLNCARRVLDAMKGKVGG